MDPKGLKPGWLFGPGVLPRDNGFARRGGYPLSGVLVTNALAMPRWRGPYLENVPMDPWGRAYVIDWHEPGEKKGLFVLSAGPDGIVNTTPRSTAVSGDDVGILLMP
jgi:hypothetical protein